MDKIKVISSYLLPQIPIFWRVWPSFSNGTAPLPFLRCPNGPHSLLQLFLFGDIPCSLGHPLLPLKWFILPILVPGLNRNIILIISCSWRWIFISCYLISSYLCIDCADLGLEKRDVGCLPAVVVVEEIISFHELLGIHIDYRTVYWHFTHVYCSQHCWSECLATCRSDFLVLWGLFVS